MNMQKSNLMTDRNKIINFIRDNFGILIVPTLIAVIIGHIYLQNAQNLFTIESNITLVSGNQANFLMEDISSPDFINYIDNNLLSPPRFTRDELEKITSSAKLIPNRRVISFQLTTNQLTEIEDKLISLQNSVRRFSEIKYRYHSLLSTAQSEAIKNYISDSTKNLNAIPLKDLLAIYQANIETASVKRIDTSDIPKPNYKILKSTPNPLKVYLTFLLLGGIVSLIATTLKQNARKKT
jgi:hypothetical protein